MKIRFVGLSLLILLTDLSANAQSVVGDLPGKGLDIQTGPGGFVTQLPLAPAETKGDVYLNSDWAVADIKIFNQQGELKQVPIRIDLKANEVEINTQNQVKILSGIKVDRILITNNKTGSIDKYINAKKYKLNGVSANGFVKVLDSAKWQLFVKPQLKLVQSNYVAALDAGDRNDKWVKEEVYFFSKDSNLYQVYSSTKKFSQQFGENANKVQGFIKTNKLNLKNYKDLFGLFNYLNENI
ncbi:hypothetical protein [Ohtaekwangia koreensis]|uniref:Uncharacterized protein n=1 Tax=Ohtaekwangia koreensis TaxID=688867 RepID=A0A1T5LTH5_9BACT|nr:hypothetical protein [Ohtaekwangia koreensis]SKC79276.1 hypothetical protein SAMN05660236_3901 [Ohtaekwangia koreensis]